MVDAGGDVVHNTDTNKSNDALSPSNYLGNTTNGEMRWFDILARSALQDRLDKQKGNRAQHFEKPACQDEVTRSKVGFGCFQDWRGQI